MIELRQSTADQWVPVGTLTNPYDGFTAAVGLSPTVSLSKNGLAKGPLSDGTWAEDADGQYRIKLDATDTNAAGHGMLSIPGSTSTVPITVPFAVLSQTAWDAKYSTGAMRANVTQIDGDAAAASNLKVGALTMQQVTVDTATNSHTPTTTEFQCDDVTEATADMLVNKVVIFTAAPLLRATSKITGYQLVGGIGQFTVSPALPTAPVNDLTGIVL